MQTNPAVEQLSFVRK